MKVKKFLTILIILLSFITFSYSQDQIVYLDLDKVVSNTKAGKSILIKLEKSKKNALLNFEKKEADLKKIEEEIKSQKLEVVQIFDDKIKKAKEHNKKT